MDKDIPFLDSGEAAEFDGELFRAEYDNIVLCFHGDLTELPENSRVLVSVSRKARPGEAVAVATCRGEAMTGFFRRQGEDVIIESVHHSERLRYAAKDEKKLIRWIFPILNVVIHCMQKKKYSTNRKSAGKKQV